MLWFATAVLLARGQQDTLDDILAGETQLSTLRTVLQSTNLLNVLQTNYGEGDAITVLAPSNTAFTNAGTVDPSLLSDILYYHVLTEDNFTSMDIVMALAANQNAAEGLQLSTLLGQDISIQYFSASADTQYPITINNDAKVVQADIFWGNNVIHIIDTVLIPPSVASSIACGSSPCQVPYGSTALYNPQCYTNASVVQTQAECFISHDELESEDNCYFSDGPKQGSCLDPGIDPTFVDPATSASNVALAQLRESDSIREFTKWIGLADPARFPNSDSKGLLLKQRIQRSVLYRDLFDGSTEATVKDSTDAGYRPLDIPEIPENVPSMGSQGARYWNIGLGYLMDDVNTAAQLVHDAVRGFQIAANIQAGENPNEEDDIILYMESGIYGWHEGTDKLQQGTIADLYCFPVDSMAQILKTYNGNDGGDMYRFLSCGDDDDNPPPVENSIAVLSAVLDALPVHPDFWDTAITGNTDITGNTSGFKYPGLDLPEGTRGVLTFGMAMVGERLGFPDELFAAIVSAKIAMDGRYDLLASGSMSEAWLKLITASGGTRTLIDKFLTNDKLVLDAAHGDSVPDYLQFNSKFPEDSTDQEIQDARRVAKTAMYFVTQQKGGQAMGNVNYYAEAYMYIVDNFKKYIDEGSCVENEFSFLVSCETLHMFFDRYNYAREEGQYIDTWTVLKNRAKLPQAKFLIDPKYNIRSSIYGKNGCASIFNEDSDYAWSSLSTYVKFTGGSLETRIRRELVEKAMPQTTSVFSDTDNRFMDETHFTAYGSEGFNYAERTQYVQKKWNGPWTKVGERRPGYNILENMLLSSIKMLKHRPGPCPTIDGPPKAVLAPRQISAQSYTFGAFVNVEAQAQKYRDDLDTYGNVVKFGVPKDNVDSCTAVLGAIWDFNEEQVLFDTEKLVSTGNFYGSFPWEPYETVSRQNTDRRFYIDTFTGGTSQFVSDGPFSLGMAIGFAALDQTKSQDIAKLFSVATPAGLIIFNELNQATPVNPADDFGQSFVTLMQQLDEQNLPALPPFQLLPDQKQISTQCPALVGDIEEIGPGGIEQNTTKTKKKNVEGNAPPFWAYSIVVDGIILVLTLPVIFWNEEEMSVIESQQDS